MWFDLDTSYDCGMRLRIKSQRMDNIGINSITLTNDRHEIADFCPVSMDGKSQSSRQPNQYAALRIREMYIVRRA